MSSQVIFLEVHGMQIHHSLNSQTGYLGAKVKLFDLHMTKKKNYSFYQGLSL